MDKEKPKKAVIKIYDHGRIEFVSVDAGVKSLCPKHNVEMTKLPVLWGMPAPTEDIGKNKILGGCIIPVEEKYKYGFRCPFGGEEFFLSKKGSLIPKEYD